MNRHGYYGEKKVPESYHLPSTSAQFSHQFSPHANLQIKQEESNDGYHGNMIHILNYPGPQAKSSTFPECGSYEQNTSINDLPIDLSCVKREPPPDSLPSLNVPSTTTAPTISAPFKKIGEIVTVYQDVMPPSAIKTEPPSDYETVPNLLPLSNSQSAPNHSHDNEETTKFKSHGSPQEAFESSTVDMGSNDITESGLQKSVPEIPKEHDALDSEWSSDSRLSSGDSSSSWFDDPQSSQKSSKSKSKHHCQHQGCKRSFASPKGRTLHMNRCKYRPAPTDACTSIDATVTDNSGTESTKVPGHFYSCPECGKTFEVPNLLIMHSLTHNDKFPYTCTEDSCDTAFKTEEELANHKAAHTRKKSFPCPEFGCHKVFRSRQGYKVHSVVHMSEKDLPHVCDKCGRQFRTLGLLKQHLENTHGEPRPCPICNKVFNNSAALRQHQLVHSDDRPHSCPNVDCNKMFKCRGDLKRHMMLHSKLRAFICPYENCGKSCQMKGDLKKHMVVHSDVKPLECEECGKFFKNAEHLRKHNYHHKAEKADGDSAVKKYHCKFEGCGKSFPVPIKLRRHEARHKEEKPHACPECSKAFKVDEDLVLHLRRVHGSGKERRRWSRDPKPGVMTVLPVSSEAICGLSASNSESQMDVVETEEASASHQETIAAAETKVIV